MANDRLETAKAEVITDWSGRAFADLLSMALGTGAYEAKIGDFRYCVEVLKLDQSSTWVHLRLEIAADDGTSHLRGFDLFVHSDGQHRVVG